MKHTGVNKIKQELMPFQKIKEQLGIANIPTGITKEVVKLVKKILINKFNVNLIVNY